MESSGKIELPSAFENADIDHLVILIADMLDRLMEHNDKIPLSPEALTRFHSRSPPTISVLDYLRRIVKYANVERTCLLITLHYIDQICARLPHFTLSSLTCHRFIISAIVVASKALCDAFCTNSHYAKVGGIRVGELNMLEKELLTAIDWRLTSTRQVLDAYYVNLVRTHSSAAYTLAAPPPTSPVLSSADSDTDRLVSPIQPGDVAMCEPSEKSASKPAFANVPIVSEDPTGPLPITIEPSTVLINRATLSPRCSTGPTLEQNMAFAALRGPSSLATESSATRWTASPANLDSRAHTNRSVRLSPESVVDDSQCIPNGLVDHRVNSPMSRRENVQKRSVENTYEDCEAVVGGVVDDNRERPRTRPRIALDGGG